MVKMSSALVVLLAAGMPAAAQDAASSPRVIVTSGEGVVKRAPDRAWVTIAAESRARTPQEAQSQNSAAMAAVLEKIKGAGIPADAIQTTGYVLQPEFDYNNGKQSLRDYLARNQVQVRVDTLEKTGDVIAAAVGSGATSVSNVRFDLKDRDGAEREALRLAVQDARRRAEAAAAGTGSGTGSGVALGQVIRIEEHRSMDAGPRPMPSFAMARGEGAATPPIEGGEIEIRSQVTLTIGIR